MGSRNTLKGFAEQHRLRMNSDECHDAMVRGKVGHLFAHDAGWFGIVLEAPANSTFLDNTLRSRKRRAIAAGLLLRQEGDFEAILLFEPTDAKQARLAIRLIQAKKIKKAPPPTDAQLRVRALFSSKARSKRPCFDQNADAAVGQGGNRYQSLGLADEPPIARKKKTKAQNTTLTDTPRLSDDAPTSTNRAIKSPAIAISGFGDGDSKLEVNVSKNSGNESGLHR